MTNFVDGVAMTLPWAGGLVPATLTYQNLVASGYEWWQAGVVAGIVEGMGFVSVTTVIDIYEHNRAEQERALANSWNGSRSRPIFDDAFKLALGGAVLYLAAVLVINTFLDGSASWAKLISGGILSTFGVLGGLMVALRNQLMKRRDAFELDSSRQREAENKRQQDAQAEREHQKQIQLERERDEREYARRMQEQKLSSEMQERQFEREMRLAEKRLKLELQLAETRKEPVQVANAVAESNSQPTESHSKWQRWSQLPADEKARVTGICKQSQQDHGEKWKKEAVLQVMKLYLLKERVAYEWLKYATREDAADE